MADIEAGKVGIVITKDLSRLGRDYLMTGQYIEVIFPDHNVRYTAINDNVDTFKSENELMAFKNIFNDWFARDTSKKIRAVFKAKGQSGKPLGRPPYGYKKSDTDKYQWVIDEETAAVVKRIFDMYIGGKSIKGSAYILSEEKIPTPLAHQKNESTPFNWSSISVRAILKNLVYAGHTVNFKTYKKSYKSKKKVYNPRSEWLVFENTHPAIISQHNYDLAQEILNSNHKAQKCEEINIFREWFTVQTAGKSSTLIVAKA